MRSVQRLLPRAGLGLLELVVVVTLLGILAVILVPRFSTQSLNAKRQGCSVNKNNIEVQCQLWLRRKSAAPLANLSDIGADPTFFTEGLPTRPVDGSAYSINTTTLQVNGHTH